VAHPRPHGTLGPRGLSSSTTGSTAYPRSVPTSKTWTCNACDHEGKTSREHLIHIAIGRTILGNRRLTPDEVRAHLQNDYFKEFGFYDRDPLHTEPVASAWLNQAIGGLICRACNQTWAWELEEAAGANLYDVTNLRGTADAQLLSRWAWFFAIKLWFMNVRPDVLRDGPLKPALSKLADPRVSVGMPVLVARLDASPRDWSFAATARSWRGPYSPFISWIIRGIVWMVVASDGPKITLPIPSTLLVDGLRRQDVVTIRRRQLVPLIAAPAAELGKPSPP
jgi:hypothetical protein